MQREGDRSGKEGRGEKKRGEGKEGRNTFEFADSMKRLE